MGIHVHDHTYGWRDFAVGRPHTLTWKYWEGHIHLNLHLCSRFAFTIADRYHCSGIPSSWHILTMLAFIPIRLLHQFAFLIHTKINNFLFVMKRGIRHCCIDSNTLCTCKILSGVKWGEYLFCFTPFCLHKQINHVGIGIFLSFGCHSPLGCLGYDELGFCIL